MSAATLTVKPFLQKERVFFTRKNGLLSDNITALCALTDGCAYVGTDKGLSYFDGSAFHSVRLNGKGSVSFVFRSGGSIWAGSGNTLYSVTERSARLTFTADFPLVSMAEDGEGKLWLLSEKCVYLMTDGELAPYINVTFGKASGFAAHGDSKLIVASEGCLLSMFGKRPRWGEIMSKNSGLPEDACTAVACDSYGNIWLGTRKGVCVYDSKSYWLTYENTPALKKGNITTIFLGENGTRCIGTDAGLYIENGFHSSFLSADRWLPDFAVTAVSASPDGACVWVGTGKGVSLITFKEMTLSDKADYYQDVTERYHVRDGGFVTVRDFSVPLDISSGAVEISDNDGLWTANYLAAEVFRYAVTGDKQAKALSDRSAEALLKLIRVSGIPGFTARAIRRPGEAGYGDNHPEWHASEDENGPLEWKGETSSDEMTGHFYALSLYHDLCADNVRKKKVASALADITDHIISHGYRLCDIDGKPTTWANWDPDDINRNDAWFWEHGGNSLELLSIFRTSYHLTGKKKYLDEYEKFVKKEHYALNCMRYKVKDAHVTHIDDNLGFLNAMTLLRYEDNAQLRNIYLMGLRDHWEYERVERSPLWNFIYGAVTGDLCDAEEAVKTLIEMPLDLTCFRTENSRRSDLTYDSGQEEYGGGLQLKAPLPADERPIVKYDNNPFLADGGSNMRAEDPCVYLLPYWLGRYYGIIGE